jgi:hypothetical protein
VEENCVGMAVCEDRKVVCQPQLTLSLEDYPLAEERTPSGLELVEWIVIVISQQELVERKRRRNSHCRTVGLLLLLLFMYALPPNVLTMTSSRRRETDFVSFDIEFSLRPWYYCG